MDVEAAAQPQWKPMPFLIRFCSLRRLPAHCSVTGTLRVGIFTRSAIEIFIGRFTRPETSIVCECHDTWGAMPWFRT
eukprot:10427915-Heterocapsa_arctica.AAC.1